MDTLLSTTEAPTDNWNQPSNEDDVLTTLFLWLSLILSILGAVVSGTLLWTLCLQNNWKPHSVYMLNLAVSEFLTSVCGGLLPALHYITPTIFPSSLWTEIIEPVASSLGDKSNIFLGMSLSVEKSLALLFKGLFSQLQTQHYSVFCSFLWGLAFLLTTIEYEFCITGTEVTTPEELIQSYELQCQTLFNFESTLNLVNCIAFIVMCILESLKQFQQDSPRPYSKLCATVFVSGSFTLLALSIALWAKDYAFEAFAEIISGIFLLFYDYRWKTWKFKKLWQKLSSTTLENHQQRDDWNVSTAV